MADYGASDTSTTVLASNQFPISEVYVPNTGLKALGGGTKRTDGNGKDYAPALMAVLDGDDATTGATTDAAVTGDVAGSQSAKLRGLNKILADIWDSVNHRIKVDASGTTVPVSGTFWQATQPVSGTITANAGTGTFTNQQSNITADYDTGAGTQNLTMFGLALPASGGAVAGGTSSNPLRIDPTGTTIQPVNGTITANIGTTNGLALDASVTGLQVSQGSTTSGQKGALIQGAVTTSAPTYTTAQTSPLSLTTAGALRVDNSANTQPVSGTITANQGGTWNITNISGTISLPTGAATSAKQPALGTAGSASSDVLTVQGIASMTALKVDGSGVTQPVSGTVSITANSSVNVAQVNGVATATGNGVSGTGVQRVTLASDSTGQVTLAAGSNTIGALIANQSVNVAQIGGSSTATAASGVQKVGIVGNAGANVDSTVGAGSAPTNQIVVGAVYNTSAPAPSNGQAMSLQADQAGNLRFAPGIALATLSAWNSSTALNATQNIFTNSGAEAVLVQLTQTTTLTAGAITFEVSYDGSNWSTIPASAVLDPTSSTYTQISLPYTVQASTNKAFLINSNGMQGLRVKLSTQITGTGTVTPNYALLPASPADTVIALSPTAANFNVTATQGGAPWSNNVTQWNSTTVDTNSGNKSAGTLRVVLATDQPALTNAQPVSPQAASSGGSTPSHTITAASTNATSLKASAGVVWGIDVSNSNAAARYLKLYDKASAPTVGTDTPKKTYQVPGSGTLIRAFPVGLNFPTGIAWAITTGIADSDTGAVGTDISVDIDWK